MKGQILIFNTKDVTSAVKLNHKLLGRIISTSRNGERFRYYRTGVLDNIPHKRLTKGCYFSKGDVPIESENLVKMKADVQLYDRDLKTGRGYWKSHAKKKNLIVKNL